MRPGPRSSSVSSTLPAAKPAVFTRTRVVCKPRCQTSCPRDFQLAHPQLLFGLPQEGERRLEAGGASPGSLPPPSPPQRQEFLGRADGPPPLPPAASSRQGRTSATCPSSNQCPPTVATGETDEVGLGDAGVARPRGKGGARIKSYQVSWQHSMLRETSF